MFAAPFDRALCAVRRHGLDPLDRQRGHSAQQIRTRSSAIGLGLRIQGINKEFNRASHAARQAVEPRVLKIGGLAEREVGIQTVI
jgi:hypothetical protein